MDPDPGGWIRIRTLIETKAQTFHISKLRIKTKPKRFDVFQNLKWNVSVYSKNFETKLLDVFQLLFCKSKTFLFFPKILEQNQNFLMCSNFFLAKAKRYYIIQNFFRSYRERFGSIMNFVSETNIFNFFGGRKWENESKRSLKNVGLTLLLPVTLPPPPQRNKVKSTAICKLHKIRLRYIKYTLKLIIMSL